MQATVRANTRNIEAVTAKHLLLPLVLGRSPSGMSMPLWLYRGELLLADVLLQILDSGDVGLDTDMTEVKNWACGQWWEF